MPAPTVPRALVSSVCTELVPVAGAVEEIAAVVRSRAINPKWIEGCKRHGYKGAFEIAATVDYMFAFAATTGPGLASDRPRAGPMLSADSPVPGHMAPHSGRT